MSTTDAGPFWDGAHAARPAATNPQPNHLLAETVTGLPPGEALDLGCGNGGDALWLARRGWRVTAVDISAVAAARLADLAVACGLGDFLAAGLDLDPTTWTVERAEAPRRIATGPGGHTAEVTDHVLLIRRTA